VIQSDRKLVMWTMRNFIHLFAKQSSQSRIQQVSQAVDHSNSQYISQGKNSTMFSSCVLSLVKCKIGPISKSFIVVA